MFLKNPAPVVSSEHRTRVFALRRAAIPRPCRSASRRKASQSMHYLSAVAPVLPVICPPLFPDRHPDFALSPFDAGPTSGPDKLCVGSAVPCSDHLPSGWGRQEAAPIPDDWRHRHLHDAVAPTLQ